jgi:membrane protease YdiL (CAAX protease family)
VLSAAIFALLHVGQGPAPIPLFFLAIGLGYLYRQTHRVAPSFIVHLMINSLSMAVMWAGLVLESS